MCPDMHRFGGVFMLNTKVSRGMEMEWRFHFARLVAGVPLCLSMAALSAWVWGESFKTSISRPLNEM